MLRRNAFCIFNDQFNFFPDDKPQRLTGTAEQVLWHRSPQFSNNTSHSSDYLPIGVEILDLLITW